MGSPTHYSRSSRRSRSRSPSEKYSKNRRYSRSRSRSPRRRSRSPHNRRDYHSHRQSDNQERRGKKKYTWGRPEDNEVKEEEPVEKAEPNFGLSGKLAKETNTVNGVELKYVEPPEAAKPKAKWRLYVFKGDEQIGIKEQRLEKQIIVTYYIIDILHIHRQSSYLIGRDRAVKLTITFKKKDINNS